MMNRSAALAALLLLILSAAAAPAQTHAHSQSAAHTPPDQLWNSLADGNRRFVGGTGHHQDYVARRAELAQSQHPLIAVLSCSDSRVPPEILFDQGLGDLFVVRSAGNSADALALGSLEYAVEHLGTSMIVVLGHQSCGAVSAACSSDKVPSQNLEAVVQPIERSCSVAREQKAGGDLIDFAVHDHVHRTAQELLTRSPILKHAVDEGHLAIVEAYYSLNSGVVTRLR